MRFILFSKTMYSETPRIRHQLAELLLNNGHEVIFYQKPLFFFHDSKSLINQKLNNRLEIRQTKQLLHHQLRIMNIFNFINSKYEIRQIKLSANDIGDEDIIINFNYDYSFLRKIFKNNIIITLINDDFVAQAKFNKGKHVLKTLRKTLITSNATLAVSYPLIKQAKCFSKSTYLFLPWAKESYKYPLTSTRQSILLWAHIDGRIDLSLIEYLLKLHAEFNFHFVGPVSEENVPKIKELQNKYNNLYVFPSRSLNDLNLDSYFVSIIPYKKGVTDIEAVTASNKTFQLLSKGLPLVTHGMPNFFNHKAIFKANSYQEFSNFLIKSHKDFYSLQPSIESLIKEQQPEQRYSQIMSIISKEKPNV